LGKEGSSPVKGNKARHLEKEVSGAAPHIKIGEIKRGH